MLWLPWWWHWQVMSRHTLYTIYTILGNCHPSNGILRSTLRRYSWYNYDYWSITDMNKPHAQHDRQRAIYMSPCHMCCIYIYTVCLSWYTNIAIKSGHSVCMIEDRSDNAKNKIWQKKYVNSNIGVLKLPPGIYMYIEAVQIFYIRPD